MAWHCFGTLDVYIMILLLRLAVSSTQYHSSLKIIPYGLPDHVAQGAGLFTPSFGCAIYLFPVLGPTESWKPFMSSGSQS